MTLKLTYAHPVLSCKASICYEKELFGDDPEKEWVAMQKAGSSIAENLLHDFLEISTFPQNAVLLILVGKGHNGGDALIATEKIVSQFPLAKAYIVLAAPESALKPLTYRSLDLLRKKAGEARVESAVWPSEKIQEWGNIPFTLSLDGLLGMNFKAPLRAPYKAIIQWTKTLSNIPLKAAVDLPSGIGDESGTDAYPVDFTYATGIAKTPLFKQLHQPCSGRIRYLDLGFFDESFKNPQVQDTNAAILLPSVLKPLRRLRQPISDKRSYGHAFLLGGCRNMPGALLMSVLATLRSGAGLVTAAAPASFCPAFAAAAPEAMWIPWQESEQGFWNLSHYSALIQNLQRATALLIGPGMEPQSCIKRLVLRLMSETTLPLVLDAGALQSDVAAAAAERKKDAGAVIITPHFGEFKRFASIEATEVDDDTLKQFCSEHRLITILKGPMTRICDGKNLFYSPFGGPVLARGGSGDILAGLTLSLLARPNSNPFLAACQAVTWHGLTAESLARRFGHEAVHTTQLLSCLYSVLRGER